MNRKNITLILLILLEKFLCSNLIAKYSDFNDLKIISKYDQSFYNRTVSKSKTDNALLLQADNIYYDRKDNSLLAENNILLYYQVYTLKSKKLYYNYLDNIIVLDEDITINYDNKISYQGSDAIINLKSYAMKISNLHGEINPNGFFIADKLISNDGKKFSLFNSKVSLCKVCKSNFIPNTPLWALQAKMIEWDKDEHTIKYKDLYLDIWGKPILYLPYFITPDPDSPGKSGFLLPTMIYNNILGVETQIPLYLRFSNTWDITLSPLIGSKTIYDINMRQLFTKGAYNVKTKFLHVNNNYPVYLNLEHNYFVDNREIGSYGDFAFGKNTNAFVEYQLVKYANISGVMYQNIWQNNKYLHQEITTLNNLKDQRIFVAYPNLDFFYNKQLINNDLNPTFYLNMHTTNLYNLNGRQEARGIGCNLSLNMEKKLDNNIFFLNSGLLLKTIDRDSKIVKSFTTASYDIGWKNEIHSTNLYFAPLISITLRPSYQSYYEQYIANSLIYTTMDFQPQTARFTDDIDLMSIARKDSSINYGFTGTLYNIISDKFYFTMRSKTYLQDMEKYRLKSKFIDQQIFNKLNSYNTVCITDIVINSKSHFIGNKNIIVQKNDIFTLNSTELYLDTQLKSSELFIGYVFLNKNTNYLLNQNSDKTIYNNYLKLETNHNINNKWSVYFTNIIKFSFDNILDFKQKRIGIGITYHIDCLNINLNMQQDGYKTLIDKTKPIKPISYSINFEIPKFNTL